MKIQSSISILRAIMLMIPLIWMINYSATGQIREEDEFERMLLEEVEVENPVYKPVIGFGVGNLSFFGDVNDYHRFLLGSKPGIKLNISSFLDNKRRFKVNFFFLGGKLSGNERSYIDLDRNLNFESEIINLGINFEYNFGHILKPGKLITPFLSVGLSSFQFNSKGDLFDSDGNRYFYWSDGTIRDVSQTSPFAYRGEIVGRNYNYETDLRNLDLYGLGNYPQFALAIPVDAGFDLKVTERVNMRVGTSLYFSFTDVVDNVSSQGAPITGRKRNDWFGYSYVTFHLDLFSDPKTRVIERLFAMQEFDYTTVEDEDNDGVFDFYDLCPGTPFGVEVDEDGCPIDSDGDGIPDYRDEEPNSRPGAFVDENGVEIDPDDLVQLFGASSEAVLRNELHLYTSYEPIRFSRYAGIANLEIPQKFKFIDLNNDGYISYEELLRAIDSFFDFASPLTTEDIYELNEFFFAQ